MTERRPAYSVVSRVAVPRVPRPAVRRDRARVPSPVAVPVPVPDSKERSSA
ncbi:hypothetical protein [Streptomyces sp. NRRL F-5135]|uniref:hypothetical protein n=1 Tax=Streptomyces sp. NRRL F-5135 TaxID=1463858 RepID=UPI000B33C25F|nr:hypothetical protein [Streptomyces sp. NRRL F-5135]